MVIEIDRNPGAYPDGNVAEVRVLTFRFWGSCENLHVRYSGQEHKHKHHRWTVSRYAKLGMHLQECESSSTSTTSLRSISFTLILVSPFLDYCFCRSLSQVANLLSLKEDSRINVVHAFWNYIKINGLQDKVDRRAVRTNDELRAVGYPQN